MSSREESLGVVSHGSLGVILSYADKILVEQQTTNVVHFRLIVSLVRSGTVGRAVHDGLSAIPRPSDELLQKGVGLADELEAGFEWLKKNPDSGAKGGNRPERGREEEWKMKNKNHCIKGDS